MAFEIATAVQTPLPLPDMSSPSKSFENLSFIVSRSEKFQNYSSLIRKFEVVNQEFGSTPDCLSFECFGIMVTSCTEIGDHIIWDTVLLAFPSQFQ